MAGDDVQAGPATPAGAADPAYACQANAAGAVGAGRQNSVDVRPRFHPLGRATGRTSAQLDDIGSGEGEYHDLVTSRREDRGGAQGGLERVAAQVPKDSGAAAAGHQRYKLQHHAQGAKYAASGSIYSGRSIVAVIAEGSSRGRAGRQSGQRMWMLHCNVNFSLFLFPLHTIILSCFSSRLYPLSHQMLLTDFNQSTWSYVSLS